MLTLDEFTETERRLWDALETGELISLLEDGTDEERDPENGAEWGQERTVRAEALIEMLTRTPSPDDRPARAVRLCLAHVTGTLDLKARHLLCPLDLRKCFFDAPVHLDEARAPKLVFADCHLPGFIGHQLETRGDVSLAGSHAHSVSLYGAHIGGDLILSSAQLNNPKGYACNASGARIDGTMFCGDNFRTDGELQLLGTHIGGQLILSGAQLNNPKGYACNADGARIGRGMFCREGFRVAGELRLLGAHIGGQLDLSSAQLSNPTGHAFNADRIRIDGSLFSGDNFRADGELRLLSAHIGGQLILSSAQLYNPKGNTLSADGAQIDQDMFCKEGFRTEGELRLPGIHIGGQLDLSSAQLSNPKGNTLSADGAQIDGDMFCREGFRTEGELRLPGIHIGGQLDLSSAQLSNPKGNTLNAGGAQIDEDMFCREGFRTEGELRLPGIHIEGQLDLSSAQLSNPGMSALGLQGAVITHVLLPALSTPEGTLDLMNARVTHVEDNWPKTLYTTRIAGLTYESISPLDKGAAERLNWLSNAEGGYLPQPYEQLATVLRRMGRDDDARRVAIAKEKSRRPELSFTRRAWNSFLALAVGYGYQPWRGALWLGLLALIGWPVFAWAKAHHHFVALNEKTQHLPQFHAWLYSLDSVLPVINLGQKNYWSATGSAQYWQTASVLAGWILVTVILAAVTTRFIRE